MTRPRADNGNVLDESLANAVHTGDTNRPAPGRKELGSPLLFRESVEAARWPQARPVGY